MNFQHIMGAVIIMALVIIIGIYAGKKVNSASDFASASRRASLFMVMGALIGTLVGGASTIGTAQLAFSYGFSAWWFTLGGGLGLIVMAVFYIKPVYNAKAITIPGIISLEYGEKAGFTLAVLSSVGSFITIVSQIISGVALITAVISLSPFISTTVVVMIMMVYVLLGGALGASYVGMFKTIILYIFVGYCGILAIHFHGGINAFLNSVYLPSDRFFNLLARGPARDIGAGISLILGVITTQAYISAVISAKTEKTAKIAAYISGILIPVIGIAGIFVGLYMKLNYPDIQASMALPLFIIKKIPPLIGGMMLCTLLIAVVGTGAGIALGMSNILTKDIIMKLSKKNFDDRGFLLISRLVLVLIFLVTAVFSFGNLGGVILNYSFLSMGLRGAAGIVPFSATLFMKGKISSNCAIASMIAGVVLTLAGKLILPSSIDPLFLGLLGSIMVLIFNQKPSYGLDQ